MTDCFEPQIFIRHHRQLRALQLENQAWFCLPDIARLMGKPLDERATYKLDPDQRRTAWLNSNGQWTKHILISESGLFAMLVHHYVPENRALRQWLTHEVLPTLRDKAEPCSPSINAMKWAGCSVGLLQWQSDYWVRLRDLPELMVERSQNRRVARDGWKSVLIRWRQKLIGR
ncbi:Prophage antirepressor [Pseudomonas sp. NFACC02]|uniref:BRO-N domain-containing protein n=1 Tax=Pseudomonas sp. NFACC02 TaxID=1566250 RepID=UPI0008D3C903|nr:Bro-N domain-containing protein [Pseudomonas sp. NFACC02]SER57153.1 Prophage antirepressor [Pseudomonas sp. NFACC02]